MRRERLALHLLILLFLFLLVAPATTRAQQWSGIIDPSRAIDWSGAGVPGGVPNRTTICATLNPGATSAQINSAIASCPSGQVVFLNAGTYNLSSGIDFANHSNVTLRGAGANSTFLLFSGDTSCAGLGADICLENGETSYPGGPSNTANWTGGYSKGTTQITLSSTANLVAGKSLIVLDQLNDSSDPGTIFICETTGVCSNGGQASGERSNRSQQQIVLVTAVNGNTVTISPGLYMPNWRSSQSPGAWWSNTVVTASSVENLSVDHSNSNESGGIVLFNAYKCWVKGIRSINANRNHVWIYVSAHSIVRDSYFYGTQSAASQSYGVESYMGSDNLVENNIFQRITAPMIVNAASSGTVWGYNYAVNDYYSVSPNWMMPSNFFHAAGTDNILVEGNNSVGFITDNVHGTHNFLTAFRNQFTGWEPNKQNQTDAVQLYSGSRYMNIVGNVLGTAGYHNNYQSLVPLGLNGNTSIYTLGWSGNGGSVDTSCCPNDPLVAATLMRWGNYDTVNNAVQWNPLELASGLIQFANLVPSTQNLPPSFYLSAKPSWWGGMPWPAAGPDVTGGTDPSGHVYPNPAQFCYMNVMHGPMDGSGAVAFVADACYGSATLPSPPTNLSIIVH